MKPIAHACQILGGQTALADTLGVTVANVNQWVAGTRPVPVEKCVAIEVATKGAVDRCSLYKGDPEKVWPELCK